MKKTSSKFICTPAKSFFFKLAIAVISIPLIRLTCGLNLCLLIKRVLIKDADAYLLWFCDKHGRDKLLHTGQHLWVGFSPPFNCVADICPSSSARVDIHDQTNKHFFFWSNEQILKQNNTKICNYILQTYKTNQV